MLSDIFRIIDANLNRSREGLRVIEDWARFSLNDGALSKELKSIRHEIQNNVQIIDPNGHSLLSNRDILGDVGVNISLQSEMSRIGIDGLLKANICRVEESFRVLEEYSKLLSVKTSFESLRYRIYDVERQILNKANDVLKENLYIILTSSLCEAPIEDTLKKLLVGGFKLFQLREKKMALNDFVVLAKKLIGLCRLYGAKLIINDRIDVALVSGADGVHIGKDDIRIDLVRKASPSGFIIGLTVHDEIDKKTLGVEFADYLGIGPIFSTTTKPNLVASGLSKLKSLSEGISIPVFFIGGIQSNNVNQLIEEGINQVAVCSGVISQPDSLNSALKIKSLLLRENVES